MCTQSRDIHAIGLGHCSDVIRSSDGTSNGRLLLVIGQTLPCEIGAAALRDLKNDRRFDIAASRSDVRETLKKRGADRAASSAALAVEDDVTFCGDLSVSIQIR